MLNILFADGFEEVEALSVVDMVRRAGIEVNMISLNKTREVVGGHNIKIVCDSLLEEATLGEGVVLPGGIPGVPNIEKNDIAVEFGNDLASAKDIEWTVEEGAVMLINGGFYATGAGTSKLTATYKGVTKNIYVIANAEGDNTFYLVNENLKSATLPANTWYYADKTFGGSYANNWSNGAVTSVITSSSASTGYTMGNPWGGGNNSRALFYSKSRSLSSSFLFL